MRTLHRRYARSDHTRVSTNSRPPNGLGRLKKVNLRLYAVLQIFLGLGAVLAEISKPTIEKVAPQTDGIFQQTSHGLNLGWSHASLIMVAVLIAAEGFAAWRESSRA
jgi:hypothetical protein